MSAALATVPRVMRPQAGPQEHALASPADIVIMGGAAGVGKTYALLMEPLRHVSNPGFGAVIFRRDSTQITNEGGLWDESEEIYPPLGALANLNSLSWRFPRGAKVRFSHLQYAKDRFAWDGAQVPLLGFDQLESFEEIQFWYMLARNRTTCGVRPYVRATCNPVPADDEVGGWLHKLISWWLDEETGYPRWDRSGAIRWFVRLNETLHWAGSRAELIERFPDTGEEDMRPKSLTFIPGRLSDNKILGQKNPEYRANLLALPLVERERLLGGNWKIKPTAGKVFNREWFRSTLRAVPADVRTWVRYWDKAGTEGGGKFSAGVLMGQRTNGRYLLADVVRGQWSALNRETRIKQTAEADAKTYGSGILVWTEQEPGSGGKESAENTVRNLAGHTIRAERVTGDKVTRAGPLSAQAEAGNVDLLEGDWNEAFLVEAQNFDGVHGFSDQIDAASGAFNKLAKTRGIQDIVIPMDLKRPSGWMPAGYADGDGHGNGAE